VPDTIRYTVGGYRRLFTLEEALAKAKEIHAKTGVFVSVEVAWAMTGKEAYEADLDRQPLYHDGTPRPGWEELHKAAQWSWERNPTPRDWS
jgi:hypothetical protein